MNSNFREYATRIGFNVSLTRNQIDAFERVAFEIAHWKTLGKPSVLGDSTLPSFTSYFSVGMKKLCSMGLIVHHDPGEMNPPWSKCVWSMTSAGEALYALLVEAGLVRKPVFSVKAA